MIEFVCLFVCLFFLMYFHMGMMFDFFFFCGFDGCGGGDGGCCGYGLVVRCLIFFFVLWV